MKLTVQTKKPKNALGKVFKKTKVKRSEKDSLNLKKAAVLELSGKLLDSPEKKKLAKSLKKEKLVRNYPDQFEVTAVNSKLKPRANKSSTKVDLSFQQEQVKKNDSPKSFLKLKKTSKKDKLGNASVVSVLDTSLEDKNVSAKKTKKVKRVNNEVPEFKINAKKETSNNSLTKKVKKIKSEPQKDEQSVKKEVNEETRRCSLQPKLLKGVCASTLKLVQLHQEADKKKDLFGSQPQQIILQLDLFKVPTISYRTIHCRVPYSVLATEPEVCLIVPDSQRGRKRDTTLAKFVEQYEEKLLENGTKGIKQIIPFTQLRAEYSQFEIKRRLAHTFDVFLCDGRISGHCLHFLGKVFEKAKKSPIPIHAVVKVNGKYTFVKDLQKNVDDALRKVSLTLHSHGTTYSIPVGHSELSHEQLADNIEAVWKVIEQELPGGIKNIRTAYLKGPLTSAVPLYASLVPLANVPVVKPAVVKEPIEDELSTLPGRRVTVYPTGEVKVSDHRTKEDLEFTKLNPPIEPAKSKKRKQERKESSMKKMKAEVTLDDEQSLPADDPISDEEDFDDKDDADFKDVEAAEAAYLSQWSESASLRELEDEENKSKEKPKKKKKKKAVVKSMSKSDIQTSKKKGISQRYSKGKNAKKSSEKRS